MLLQVTDTRTGTDYRLEAPSKTKARNQLTRYDDQAGEYRSFWELNEISFSRFRRLPDVPSHLID